MSDIKLPYEFILEQKNLEIDPLIDLDPDVAKRTYNNISFETATIRNALLAKSLAEVKRQFPDKTIAHIHEFLENTGDNERLRTRVLAAFPISDKAKDIWKKMESVRQDEPESKEPVMFYSPKNI